MSSKAPVSRKKKGTGMKKTSSAEAEKFFGDFSEELELGKKYKGFYEQLHKIYVNSFKEDGKKFLKHLKEKGDDIELEFEIYTLGRSIEKKEVDEKAYIDDIRGLKCSECGSTRTGSEERQFRSLDEGSTKRFMCENCFKRKI